MKMFPAVCTFIVFVAINAIGADETIKVAVVEFQNKANHIISENRWTMAEDLGKYLRKNDKSIQVVKRKELMKVLDELEWNGDRLSDKQETAIANMGVRYLIYGTIAKWRIRGPVTQGYEMAAPQATVVFTLDVVDMKTRRSVGSVMKDGNATGSGDRISIEDPMDPDESKHEDELYEARDIALRKAAKEIVQAFAKQ